ncbi:hypothetical protein [Burkholderia ambifaria]|uniref:hypothetical protein n=1 Tax=Burkholderia ambifaria TaxID=152480 RepID=UPI0015883F8F|nr:hypothetical protein [Burkholderia ambifaria]WDR86118.1 hypothetical protein OR986_06790 [Burkholderia ambifaria]WDR98750.1 hypothetical protein OR985_11750 [Burkholderia ambifaria]
MKIFEIYAQLFRRLASNRRPLILIATLSGVGAIISIAWPDFSFSVSKSVGLYMTSSTPFSLLVISIIIFSFLYLQSGGNKTSAENDKEIVAQLNKELSLSNNQFEEIGREIEFLKEKIETSDLTKGFSHDERLLIVDGIVEKTGEEAISSIFEKQTVNLENRIRDNLSFDRLTDSSRHIVTRLRREITDLRLRSNINLLIGMAITAGGLYLLWTTVAMIDASTLLKALASEGSESNAKFVKNFVLPIVPRVLLVVFVEIFAYFFLQLYKSGLSEIKYFQNELTNVESKLVAVEFSYITSSNESLKSSLEALSHTERNFVLEKGQTTVELERAKSESELTRNIIKTIPEIFKKSKK